jgi:hypothetical protein
MKFIKNLLAIAGIGLALATPAMAQTGFNMFAEPRTLAWVWPQTVNSGSSSNFCLDIHGYDGIAKVDIVTITNGACSAGTLTLYTSSDRTNWVALPNYALMTSNSIIYTNTVITYQGGLFAGPQLATNIIMYPGTITTPTAALAGFATKYILPAPFTNSAALTLSNGLITIGFSIPDQARYLQAFYSFTGASTNTISMVLTARKQQE